MNAIAHLAGEMTRLSFFLTILSGMLVLPASAVEIPEPISKYFELDKPAMAQVVTVRHSDEYLKLQDKIFEAFEANPKTFLKAYEKHDAGKPYPWTEHLGLTEEEHAAYLEGWNQRRIEPVGMARLRLVEAGEGKLRLHVEGSLELLPSGVAHITYDTKEGVFETLNGTTERITDVEADKNSIFGAWKGEEWKVEQSDDIAILKENIVLGQRDDDTYCFLIYRLQELRTDGVPLEDAAMVLRFKPLSQREEK